MRFGRTVNFEIETLDKFIAVLKKIFTKSCNLLIYGFSYTILSMTTASPTERLFCIIATIVLFFSEEESLCIWLPEVVSNWQEL